MKIFRSFATRWNGYWFERDLLLSAGVLRICVGISVMMMLVFCDYGDYTPLLDQSRAAAYEPVGILQLMGKSLPPAALFNFIRIVAFVSTAMYILGIFTRVVKWLSLVTSLMIVSMLFSWGGEWSHGENIPLLMHLAMVFAPSQVYLSVDALIFRNKPGSWWIKRTNNGWAVYLAMLAAVIMFTNAGFYKLSSDFSLGWAFSDNLRYYLVQQYLVIFQKPMPAYLEWTVNHEWGYKGLALLNMISQLGIVFVIFFTKRPVLRFLFGLIFLLESLGLYFVMGYENFSWWILVAAFVDWEWLFAKFTDKKRRCSPSAGYNPKYKRTATIIASVYILFFIITAFDKGKGWEKGLRPYPFSGFSMFSSIMCDQPYSQHRPIYFPGNEFVFDIATGNQPYADSLKQALMYEYYRYNYTEPTDTLQVHEILNHPLTFLSRLPQTTIHRISWFRLINECPAYPARAQLRPIFKGLMGKIDNGRFKTLVAQQIEIKEKDVYLKLVSEGYAPFEITAVKAIIDQRKGPFEMVFETRGETLVIKNVQHGENIFMVDIREKNGSETDTYLIGKTDLKK